MKISINMREDAYRKVKLPPSTDINLQPELKTSNEARLERLVSITAKRKKLTINSNATKKVVSSLTSPVTLFISPPKLPQINSAPRFELKKEASKMLIPNEVIKVTEFTKKRWLEMPKKRKVGEMDIQQMVKIQKRAQDIRAQTEQGIFRN